MSNVMGIGGQKPPGAQINVKLTDLKDICCENCGGKYFRAVHAFKKLSALISPSGKEQIVPVPTYRCDDCGYINEEFQIKVEKDA